MYVFVGTYIFHLITYSSIYHMYQNLFTNMLLLLLRQVPWSIKKAECWRIDVFELWCWRRPLRAPWTARRSNQSILKEISPEYSLEGLMLKLKLQDFGRLIWRTDPLEKTLILGKIEGRRRRGGQRMRWLDGITDLMDMSLSKLQELVIDGEARHSVVHGVVKCWTWLSAWIGLRQVPIFYYYWWFCNVQSHGYIFVHTSDFF